MSDVLRQKLNAQDGQGPGAGVSIRSVLRKVMPRTADAALSLDLHVVDVTVEIMRGDAFLKALAPEHLVYMLNGSEGARGFAVLDASLMSSIVEIQVSGRVSAPKGAARAPTPTDAAVVAGFLDRWLGEIAREMDAAGLVDTWPPAGFSRGPGALRLREVELLLDDVSYRTVSVSVSIGNGGRTGEIRFVVPPEMLGANADRATIGSQIRAQLVSFPVELPVILARLHMPVSKAKDLQVDDVLPLPDKCLQNVELVTVDGKVVQTGRLGQFEGYRAVRLASNTKSDSNSGVEAAPGADTSGQLGLPAPDPMPLTPPDGPSGSPDLQIEQSNPDTPVPIDPPTELPDLPPLPALDDLPELPPLPET